jgi:hypothetical protein
MVAEGGESSARSDPAWGCSRAETIARSTKALDDPKEKGATWSWMTWRWPPVTSTNGTLQGSNMQADSWPQLAADSHGHAWDSTPNTQATGVKQRTPKAVKVISLKIVMMLP